MGKTTWHDLAKACHASDIAAPSLPGLEGRTHLIGSAAEREDQFVPEILVRDLEQSLAFYSALGFTLERCDASFAALRWGTRWLFLDERPDLQPHSGPSRANVRVLVDDVEGLWAKVQAIGVPVERPISDRYYGFRDFTILDPDGFGLRFATPLGAPEDKGFLLGIF